ncbi:Alpha/Beta hydrolase protein [Rhypophila decipiens]|uniref:Alpha/Beta hydrolase protein n=1 Tax=Rhypophila decipiens TaxID=261697 RepID=A0AAN6YH84_9PEZI|nr:Alpha/Beta hydrolase protein [Rhypophila decipiens]
MPITSDIILDATRFSPDSVSEATLNANSLLESLTTKGPRWHQVGAEKYRQMRATGETALPPPIYLPLAKDATIPSRDGPDRTIPVRVYEPEDGHASRGIFLHIHGGGFVLASEKDQDATLNRYANTTHLTAISIGYRLAPEHPYPAALDDCTDVASYLVDHGLPSFSLAPQSPLIISGESAGGCLAVQTCLFLLRTRTNKQQLIRGLVLPFGQFDLTLTLPSISKSVRPLLINHAIMAEFREAYAPGMSLEMLQRPEVSPLYEDLMSFRELLPPALFMVGTEDPLLDDTLLMSAKWMSTGAETAVKVWPGASHGFTAFEGDRNGIEAREMGLEFVGRVLGD